MKTISNNRNDKIHFSIYADDFIITGKTKEVLENKVKPAVEKFLQERGLSLSQEKTKITHIDDGFDFLGANVRKYRGKLIIKPSKNSVKALLNDIKATIKAGRTARKISYMCLTISYVDGVITTDLSVRKKLSDT